MDNPYDSATPEQKLWMLRTEIITPLSVITGYTNVIRKDIESKNIDPDELLKEINYIEKSAKKIRELLDGMADFLRAS